MIHRQLIAHDQMTLDDRYMHLLESTSFQPIFIMGPFRSGTTILHQILDATGCFNVIRIYHLLYYNQLLANYSNHTEKTAKQQLRDLFDHKNITDRGIDHVASSPDLEEEYGFFFDGPLQKRRLNAANLPRFFEICKKIQVISDPPRPLLLKNPWDSINFTYIKRVLPEAKFIFIHRHPLHVINSQLNAVRSLLATKNPYVDLLITDGQYGRLFERPMLLAAWRSLFSDRLGIGLRLLVRYEQRVTNYFLQHIDVLPRSDAISIRYEDLCADAETTMKSILNFLGLQPRKIVAYNGFIEPRALRLLPEIARKRDQIGSKLQAYYAYNGYEI